jgi:hypothetical protein
MFGGIGSLANRLWVGGPAMESARPVPAPGAGGFPLDFDVDDGPGPFGAVGAAGTGKAPRKSRALVNYRTVSTGTLDEVTDVLNKRTRKALNLGRLSMYQPRYERAKTKDYVTSYRCRFYGAENGSCPFLCRIIEQRDDICMLQESECGHSAHDTYTGARLQPVCVGGVRACATLI